MSKISKQVDQQQSDSDLSLQLSDASSLTSDSDLSDTQQQQQQRQRQQKQVKKKAPAKKQKKTVKKPAKKAAKNKKKTKDDSQYCTCRRGYDGKEFMIECDGCQEWFHGACVGLKPNSVTDHYFCKSCLKAKKKPAPTAIAAMGAGKTLIAPPPPPQTTNKKKSLIILPIAKPEQKPKPIPLPSPPPPPPASIPSISKLSIQDEDDEDEDLDDICPVCDGDCTCGTGSTVTAPVISRPPSPPPPVIPEPPKIEVPKLIIKKTIPASKSKKSKIPKKSISAKNNAVSSLGMSDSVSDMSDSSGMSDEDDAVIERVGANIKKKPVPKKKAAPAAASTSAGVRRGKSTTSLASIARQKTPHYAAKGRGKGTKNMSLIASSIKMSSEEDSDEEVVVDDLDDLLETMSPLSEHSSNESDNSLLESEEFFTDDDDEENEDNVEIDSSSLINSPYPDSNVSYSSVHIDSGDDEDIEDTETRAIIADMTLNSDEELDEDDSDLDEGMFVEDDDDDDEEMEGRGFSISYYSGNNNWSTDEDEEEEEFDYTTAFPSEDDLNNADIEDSDEDLPPNPLLPLLDSEGNLYDSIAAAFMQALVPTSDIQQSHNGDASTEANTPNIHTQYQLSPFELAHALSVLSGDRQNSGELLRRPSLPSSAVSAAQRNRGSQDINTSEALRALSALVSDDLNLSLEPIHESEDISDSQEMDTKETPASSPSSPSAPHSLTISTDLASQPPSAVTTPTAGTGIIPNQLALSLSTDLKLQEQLLDILKGSAAAVAATAETPSTKSPNTTALFNISDNADDSKKMPATSTSNTTTSITAKPATTTSNTNSPNISIFSSNSSRQILPKPSGSGVGSSSSASSFFPISLTTAALEQQIQDAINESIENNKRRELTGFISENNNSIKKRRLSLSLGNNLHHMETTSFSTPASPTAMVDEFEDVNIEIDGDAEEGKGDEEGTAVSMDDLVDTSQLYTRSTSRSPSPEADDDSPYSRDLSRWQRIPIGAFRLMRSKNKLWLER